MKLLRCFLIIALFLIPSVPAEAIDSSAGTSGFQFLRVGVGSRQLALGEAACALKEDANAIFWNPAGLAKIDSPAFSFSHNQWIAGVSQQAVAAAFPTRRGVIGAGILYLHMDELSGYGIDAQGNPVKTSDFTSYDAAGILSYSNTYKGVSYGAAVKVFQEKIENSQASGIAFDFGAINPLSDNLDIAFAAQNIGTGTRFIDKDVPLPQNFKAGLALRLLNNKLLVAADINKPNDNGYKAGFGAEYRLNGLFALRAGYNGKDGLSDWITAGAGFTMSGWTVDYAFVPYGKLGDTHRISISTKLGSNK